MKILKINSLCGVKNQLYDMEQYVDDSQKHEIKNGFFDINSLFWSKMLSPSHIKDILNLAAQELSDYNSVKVQAALNDIEKFMELCLLSLDVFRHPVDEKELFSGLETLEIICFLYSKLVSSPYILTLSSGYIHSSASAADLVHNCLLPMCNPYLDFIETEVLPQIIDYQPDVLLFSGKPNIASFAIAKAIRKTFPAVFIIAVDHDSDYYSLNKIKRLLSKNDAFFSVYHCAILCNTEIELPKVLQALSIQKTDNLKYIPHLIYSIDNGLTICNTTEENASTMSKTSFNYHSSINVINLKAFPNNYCYWNNCTFCGINYKYENKQNDYWDVNTAFFRMKSLYDAGAKNIWLLDEAIPVGVLKQLAELLINNDVHIYWHVRTRIEPQFVEEGLVNLLYKAGLRQILFGFESASKRILHLMHKTPYEDNYLEIAEKIVDKLLTVGVFVHFSSIIGFPTETKDEREETLDFLQYLRTNYMNFSYNINSFYLDIGSKIYRRWERFGISSLAYPCPPQYFLDNHLEWKSAIMPDCSEIIQSEKEHAMIQQYPWYPSCPLIPPSLFFAFWEYSRYGFLRPLHNNFNNQKKYIFDRNSIIQLSPWNTLIQRDHDSWLLYNLKNHHFVVGGIVLFKLVEACKMHCTFDTFISTYKSPYQEKVKKLLEELARKNFFI